MSFLGLAKDIIPTVIPAFTELAGGLLGGALNSAYQRSQLRQQVAAQKELWAYQQQNAHQYEVEDLRNAGLNPILSATNSQIASMPSVSTPTSAPYQGVSNGLGQVINSALKLSIEKDLKIKDQEIASRGLTIEEKKLALQKEKTQAEINKINTDMQIAFEDLEIRKELKNATLEEKHAIIENLLSRIHVNTEMANKLGMETRELERKIRYGAFFTQYIPDELCEFVYGKMGDLIKSKPFDEFITKYNAMLGDNGEPTDPEAAKELAMKIYNAFLSGD